MKRLPPGTIRQLVQETLRRYGRGDTCRAAKLDDIVDFKSAIIYLTLRGLKNIEITTGLGCSGTRVSVVRSALRKTLAGEVKKPTTKVSAEELRKFALSRLPTEVRDEPREEEPARVGKSTTPIDIAPDDELLGIMCDLYPDGAPD
jgi:hypothetical protein